MSELSTNGAPDLDARVDDDDDDAIAYPDPEELAFDPTPDAEGDDTIHATDVGVTA